MMLSICIPVFNFDVTGLVASLLNQIKADQIKAEIVVIDDGSLPEFKLKNQQLETLNLQYVISPNNLGRSKIRNLFSQYAKGDYLLFLDCDGKVASNNFLTNYINFILKNKPSVIYGGRVLPDVTPSLDYMLRWNFSLKRENLTVDKRLLKPYISFQTNNFVVAKTVFDKFNFNENLNQYGYEDLLFAMVLKDRKIEIDHIDNPIVNDDVELNAIFLNKAKESAESLSMILKDVNNRELVSDLKLAKAFFYLKNRRLTGVFTLFFNLTTSLLKKRLLSGKAHLRLLDVYKLGILCRSMASKTK